MNQIDRIYKLTFRKHFTNHECNFPPTREIELGDYGEMKNGFFDKRGNIRDHEISFVPSEDKNPSHETFETIGAVNSNFIAKGDITPIGIPAAKASLEIGFSSDKAVFFSTADTVYNEIEDLNGLGQKIMDLRKVQKWDKRWHIVTKVIQGSNAIVIISGGSDSSIKIEAEADVPNINLADASVKLKFGNNSKTAYKVIVPKKITLGFGLSRVYNRWFLNPGFKVAMNNEQLASELDNLAYNEAEIFGDVVPVFNESMA